MPALLLLLLPELLLLVVVVPLPLLPPLGGPAVEALDEGATAGTGAAEGDKAIFALALAATGKVPVVTTSPRTPVTRAYVDEGQSALGR